MFFQLIYIQNPNQHKKLERTILKFNIFEQIQWFIRMMYRLNIKICTFAYICLNKTQSYVTRFFSHSKVSSKHPQEMTIFGSQKLQSCDFSTNQIWPLSRVPLISIPNNSTSIVCINKYRIKKYINKFIVFKGLDKKIPKISTDLITQTKNYQFLFFFTNQQQTHINLQYHKEFYRQNTNLHQLSLTSTYYNQQKGKQQSTLAKHHKMQIFIFKKVQNATKYIQVCIYKKPKVEQLAYHQFQDILLTIYKNIQKMFQIRQHVFQRHVIKHKTNFILFSNLSQIIKYIHIQQVNQLQLNLKKVIFKNFILKSESLVLKINRLMQHTNSQNN
eukprot:TRINITY_DN3689_c0_g1_i3.p1 TRINITY_DN3689_c0_g1~~TRINITY_DN3689_c0_g1_i3.p1  ORF type:complete len:330 (+),score=-41.52 TRINITY_DN3689_c0_g1_i3:1010-1999(+)